MESKQSREVDQTTTEQLEELAAMRQFETDWALLILTLTGYC